MSIWFLGCLYIVICPQNRYNKEKVKGELRMARKKTASYPDKIFDNVYHTLITRMPQFIIPVINDAFGTRYPMDVEYEQL